MTEYRIIFHEPLPGAEWRIPVGALVRGPSGVELVKAQILPDERCLGGAVRRRVLDLGLRAVAESDSLDELPEEAGPAFLLGEFCAVPAGFDPRAWLEKHALPRPRHDPSHRIESGVPVHHQRRTYAQNFYRRFKMDNFVRPKFRANDHWAEMPRSVGSVVVTHFAGDPKTSPLLLDYVVPDMGTSLIEQASQRYSLFARLAPHKPDGTEFALVVLPGTRCVTDADEIERLVRPLGRFVRADDEGERENLFNELRALGPATGVLGF